MNTQIKDGLKQTKIFSPFRISVENMKRLMLINFEKDTDEIYVGFEPQYFDDKKAGKGIRVIGWRKDGFVDVYQQPGIPLENNNLDVAGKGLKDICHVPMEDARLEITPLGVDVFFHFTDNAGREIEVAVKENSNKKTKPFPLLAPVGSSSASPCALPLFFLYEFYFVRCRDTAVSIRINGRQHKPDGFPLPLDGEKIYFMRYSNDPFLVNFNTAFKGDLNSLTQTDGIFTDDNGWVYDIKKRGGGCDIRGIFGGDEKHRLCMLFNPAFPDITSIPENTIKKGIFSIIPYPNAGDVGGIYLLEKKNNRLNILIKPLKGWKPYKPRLMPRIIFTVAAVFKNWPKTYRWESVIDFADEGTPSMRSNWKRAGK